jgi:hypothetical protein
MLRLNERGEWVVNEDRFNRFVAYVRDEITDRTTILSRVERYNTALDHIDHELGISAPLGETHRHSINQALLRFQGDLFGEGRSITDHLIGLIRERFLAGGDALVIPEGWLYWPITAGGLGLRQAAVLVASYGEANQKRTRPTRPLVHEQDWQRRNGDWANYYRFFGILLDRLAKPKDNQVMETLVKDFIARGSTISSGKQKDLSAYWRWILYTYGPQILEQFGTFRFLITELVPLQLISQKRVEETDEEQE